MRVRFEAEPGCRCTIELGSEITGALSATDNSMIKAYDQFVSRYFDGKPPFGIDLWLTKRIPMGAGLGGGSSNAATLLRVLYSAMGSEIANNQKCQLSDVLQEITDFSVKIGADVPYLLHGGFAHVTGIGEKVYSIASQLSWNAGIILAFPKIHCDTKEMFAELDRVATGTTSGSDPLLEKYLRDPQLLQNNLPTLIQNDFEGVLVLRYPVIAETLSALRGLNLGVAGVTGSGSTVFLLPSKVGALEDQRLKECAATLEQRGVTILATRFV